MQIKGLQKLTLLDYPERTACTVFLGGCNLRCPFCHNASLVIPEKFGESIPEDEFFAFLSSRVGKLEGVCISGGEPTLHRELVDFIKRIKDMGFLVKLDTNGTNPDMLESLISARLVDYVAMDIKSSLDGYAAAVGISDFDISSIEKSVAVLRRGDVDFEFRTTVVLGLHTEENLLKIAKWLEGEKKYFLQTFEDSGDVLKSGFSGYSKAEMQHILEAVQKFIPLAQIRN
jgi:pyruvate formate lyase activating enzyme